MRFVRLAFMFLFLMLLPVLAFGQQAQAAAPNAQASAEGTSLLQRAHAAASGPLTLNDITLTGTVRRIAGSTDESGTVVMKALASGETSIEFSLSSGRRSEAHLNAEKGPVSKLRLPDSRMQIAPHQDLNDSAWFAPSIVLSRLLSSASLSRSYAGQQSLAGRTLEHIKVFPQLLSGVVVKEGKVFEPQPEMELYCDPSTLLPFKLLYSQHPGNDMRRSIPAEVEFSDYRVVNGAQIPFHIQKYANGSLVLDVQIETVTLNSGLTAASMDIQ
jgi:hypothetical protein